MHSPKASHSLILVALGVLFPVILAAPAGASLQGQPSTAQCFGITYGRDEVLASAVADASSRRVNEFPMAYLLSSMRYAWPNAGQIYAATGYPWAAGCNTGSLKKFPLVPARITGRTAQGQAKAWDGSTTRSSNVGNGHEQSDFLFLDGNNNFCLIATETPLGVNGWLPCKWAN